MKKWIKGYEGHYKACTDGFIYSYKYGKERKLISTILSSGRCTVALALDGKSKTFKVHRLIAETFLEPVDGMTEVDHINERPSDNRLENLRWADRALQMGNNSDYKFEVPHEGTLVHPQHGTVDYFDGFARKYGLKTGDIRRVIRGERKSCGGWKLA